ncbi:hypothetical protein BDN70DRAFT_767576, partial [Pholiota conissans]
MPEPGSRKSPTWSGEPKERLEFFENVEEKAQIAELAIADRVKWVVKYLPSKEKRDFWKTLEGYSPADYTVFKKSVLEAYPGAKEGETYTRKDLQKVAAGTRRKKMTTERSIVKYYEAFSPIALWLIKKNLISTED